jgi:hypothetical protein
MLQQQAEFAVGAGHWIEKTFEEAIAEATAAEKGNVKLPDVQIVRKRLDD